MYNNEIWTKHTRLILTGVIIVAIAGWVAGILQTASIAESGWRRRIAFKTVHSQRTNSDYHRLHLVPRRTEWL